MTMATRIVMKQLISMCEAHANSGLELQIPILADPTAVLSSSPTPEGPHSQTAKDWGVGRQLIRTARSQSLHL